MSTQNEDETRSLVGRIIAELRANPEAQIQLLRALLTEEFINVPARLIRVEDAIVELKADFKELKADVAQLKVDLADLKGHSLEVEAGRRVSSLLIRQFGLRRPIIVHSLNHYMSEEEQESLHLAAEQEGADSDLAAEVLLTDIIIRAQNQQRETVWVAVEVSNGIDEHDITRSRDRAALLAQVHGQESMAIVAGHSIQPPDEARAKEAGVEVLLS